MLTYQQIREFLEKIAQLFTQMQTLQEAHARVYNLSLDLSQSCRALESDHGQMTSEIDRTERIGELIRQCVYDAGLTSSHITPGGSIGPQMGDSPRI